MLIKPPMLFWAAFFYLDDAAQSFLRLYIRILSIYN